MKILKVLGLIALLLAGIGALAWSNRATVLGLIAQARLPHIAPNREVVWQQGPADPPPVRRRPNVIFILVDDMGFNDLTLNGGVAGGAVPTPNMDSIGRDGVVFENGYAGNATCAPSRASLLTGRYATRFGFEFTPAPVAFQRLVGTESEPGTLVKPHFSKELVKDTPPMEAMAVPASEITIGKLLQGQGYHTLHFGKWHLGATPGARPEDRGFDESLGFMAGASLFLPVKDKSVVNSKQPWDPIDRFLWPNLPYMVQFNGSEMFAPKGYMTDYLTDEAVKAIRANRNRPFFMYFAPNAIHTPLQATREDYDALSQIKDHRLRVYGAMVRNLDRNVGRLLATLREEGLDQDTLIIFTSDNGGAGYIGLDDINRPYRGWKATFYEGGIHTPFFMKWPGRLPAGSRYPYPVGHVDIFATVAGAAGAEAPKDRVIDGVDLAPYVTGTAKGRPHQTLFWRSGQYKAVRDGDWKLQSNEARSKVWLYDLAKDPTEKTDLAAREPERVKAILALLAQQDAASVKPLWPSLLQGPIFIDHPSGRPQKPGEEYILWDN
ncbi:MAG: sulfatase-like hydrolase/transferase [Phenylobacterium sp.]